MLPPIPVQRVNSIINAVMTERNYEYRSDTNCYHHVLSVGPTGIPIGKFINICFKAGYIHINGKVSSRQTDIFNISRFNSHDFCNYSFAYPLIFTYVSDTDIGLKITDFINQLEIKAFEGSNNMYPELLSTDELHDAYGHSFNHV
jgi:hypothetical protein